MLAALWLLFCLRTVRTEMAPATTDAPSKADRAREKRRARERRRKEARALRKLQFAEMHAGREAPGDLKVKIEPGAAPREAKPEEPDVEGVFVPAPTDELIDDPAFASFKGVLDHFAKPIMEEVEAALAGGAKDEAAEEEEDDDIDDDADAAEEKKEEKRGKSKSQLRRERRFRIAELKQLVDRPDVVEIHDCTADDPRLLIHLKAYVCDSSSSSSVPMPPRLPLL
jgi:splicing factor 3B subunit 2